MADVLRSLRHDLGFAALRALLGASRALPLPALRGLGRSLARVAFVAATADRSRAAAHLAAAFPDRDDAWRESTLRAVRTHLGALLGEVVWLWSASADAILARTTWDGLEHLTSALDAGGAALVTAHCGNWEWLNLALGARGVPMSVATREVYDTRIDDIARRLRGRFGGEAVARGKDAGRKLLVAAKRRRVVGFLIDQDIDAPGIFAEFFGRPAWTPSGAAVIALRAEVPVVTGFAARQDDGTMRLAFDPPLVVDRRHDLETNAAILTARLTARIEAQVRAHPDQWVWMHRRWRRQPGPDDTVWRSGENTRATASAATPPAVGL